MEGGDDSDGKTRSGGWYPGKFVGKAMKRVSSTSGTPTQVHKSPTEGRRGSALMYQASLERPSVDYGNAAAYSSRLSMDSSHLEGYAVHKPAQGLFQVKVTITEIRYLSIKNCKCSIELSDFPNLSSSLSSIAVSEMIFPYPKTLDVYDVTSDIRLEFKGMVAPCPPGTTTLNPLSAGSVPTIGMIIIPLTSLYSFLGKTPTATQTTWREIYPYSTSPYASGTASAYSRKMYHTTHNNNNSNHNHNNNNKEHQHGNIGPLGMIKPMISLGFVQVSIDLLPLPSGPGINNNNPTSSSPSSFSILPYYFQLPYNEGTNLPVHQLIIEQELEVLSATQQQQQSQLTAGDDPAVSSYTASSSSSASAASVLFISQGILLQRDLGQRFAKLRATYWSLLIPCYAMIEPFLASLPEMMVLCLVTVLFIYSLSSFQVPLVMAMLLVLNGYVSKGIQQQSLNTVSIWNEPGSSPSPYLASSSAFAHIPLLNIDLLANASNAVAAAGIAADSSLSGAAAAAAEDGGSNNSQVQYSPANLVTETMMLLLKSCHSFAYMLAYTLHYVEVYQHVGDFADARISLFYYVSLLCLGTCMSLALYCVISVNTMCMLIVTLCFFLLLILEHGEEQLLTLSATSKYYTLIQRVLSHLYRVKYCFDRIPNDLELQHRKVCSMQIVKDGGAEMLEAATYQPGYVAPSSSTTTD